MSAPLKDPRLVPPAAATMTYHEAARERRKHEEVLAKAITARHHQVCPPDQDIQYTVIQRNGKVKVQFSPPAVLESGYTDR